MNICIKGCNTRYKTSKRVKISSLNQHTAQKDLEVSVFSDCVAISAESDNPHDVIWTAIHLQSSLLVLGILTRGGISKGKLVHKDDLLYGDGMIKAYKLESKAAVYPRILVGQELIEVTNEYYRSVFSAGYGRIVVLRSIFNWSRSWRRR